MYRRRQRVEDVTAVQEQLGVRSAGDQSIVWLARPPDDLPFERSWERDGLRYAALSQVACDLFECPAAYHQRPRNCCAT